MFFIWRNKYKLPIKLISHEVKVTAIRVIKKAQLGAAELALDKYLKETYKISFKDACILLIGKAKFMSNSATEIIIKFPTKLDPLARIITYGTGSLAGSKILRILLQGGH